jgi:S-adenosylmethionine:tRNA-ribosyltransferase-isomerase (queuine synthetase)
MIAADQPVQRPADAKLLVVRRSGRIAHKPRAAFVDLLRSGDVVVANDAATLPASLQGVHLRSGAAIEARLAWRASLDPHDVSDFAAVILGAGDFHTRTEDRRLPPALRDGDRLLFTAAPGPVRSSGAADDALSATVEGLLDHPRLVSLHFEGSHARIWAGLARHGRPVQYAHVPSPLALWDVWTPIAADPVAFEPPSAGFALDWRSIDLMLDRGVEFVTITHAAGLSSTGDAGLDARLPFDEPYRIPAVTALAIAKARARGGRVIAVGTTVVRALEHAASRNGVVRSGEGVATGRIEAASPVRIVDVLLSGTHEPGSSHYDLLSAFATSRVLESMSLTLDAAGYRTHEFGDAVWLENGAGRDVCTAPVRLKPDATDTALELARLTADAPVRLKPDATDTTLELARLTAGAHAAVRASSEPLCGWRTGRDAASARPPSG